MHVLLQVDPVPRFSAPPVEHSAVFQAERHRALPTGHGVTLPTLSDKLFEHCTEIDEAARNRIELIVRSLAEQNGVTEQLKAENQMEWVRQMNACKAQAEEVVKAELIYD